MSPRSVIGAPRSTLTTRVMRYTGGSVVAFTTSEIVLVLCYATGIFGTTGATVAAFFAGAIPNYVLNRQWVWERRGRVRIGREVILYAIVSVVSLVAAAAATGWAAQAVNGSKAAGTAAVAAAYLVTYGGLFVAKFVVFERFVFVARPTKVNARSTRGPADVAASQQTLKRPQ
jgi:putative flippase GtrA